MKNFPQDLNDWNQYRGMVHWFSPMVLLKTAKKVVDSTLFGQYADRRLVHAALDSPINTEKLIEECCGGEEGILGEKKQSAIWVDYVADLGDGFDSTYAIAYLIGRKQITVSGLVLPRAGCLIMGGDQVYPDASREEYKVRMERPYKAAFPRTSRHDSDHPRLFLIPGNHDWYDGLTLFLAKFCSGREAPFGSWITSQKRSYFAIHLRENWWIWGFDSQLGEDIDKPQADYFHAVASRMEPDSKVILCASVPTWLKADQEKGREEYYRALHHVVFEIIRQECPHAKVPLVLGGDLHHYSRYVAQETGTNFVTAGGGGAFLHPTHSLKDEIKAIWTTPRRPESLRLVANSVYPDPQTSRRLALRNLWFWSKNLDFCLVLGILYWLCGLPMLAWAGYGVTGDAETWWNRIVEQVGILWPTPVFLLVFLVLVFAFTKTADISSPRKYIVGPLHGMAHSIVILFGTAVVSATAAASIWVPLFGDILYFLLITLGMLAVGFVGGGIWGLYLTLVSWKWGEEANSAFSAMRLNSHRHFVRMKIEGDQLTIYPVGLDKSPKRKDWTFNGNYEDANPNQDTPAIIPTKQLGQKLIEDPIVIDITGIIPISGPKVS